MPAVRWCLTDSPLVKHIIVYVFSSVNTPVRNFLLANLHFLLYDCTDRVFETFHSLIKTKGENK